MLRLGRRFMRAGAAGIGFGFLIIAGFVFWVSASARADGFDDDDVVVVIEPPARVWQGCYVGASLGASFDNSSAGVTAPITAVSTMPGEGLAFGGYVGCNLQGGILVYGLEGDFSAASNDPDWFASARLRFGVALDSHTLAYATGGISVGSVEFTATGGGLTGQTDDRVAGYVFGGGIAHALGGNMALRLEALHYAYNDHTLHFSGGGSATVDQSHTVVRVGLTLQLHNHEVVEP